MPVVDAARRVVGVIARSDFLVCIAPDHEHEASAWSAAIAGASGACPTTAGCRWPATSCTRRAVTVGVDDAAREVIARSSAPG